MGEILKNVRYRIEESGERVHHIVFTGGGSRLKNLALLLDEFMSDYSTEIKPEAQLNIVSESGVNTSVITTVLYGLLQQGKANCCETAMPAAQENGVIFSQDEMEGKDEPVVEIPVEDEKKEEEETAKTEQPEKKEEDKPKPEKKDKGKKKNSWKDSIGNLFQDIVRNMTSDPEEEQYREGEKEDNDQ